MYKYFDPSVLSKIKNMELRAKFIVEGLLVGIHRSPYHGFSTEFKEHRPYQLGDELKRIDWKIYARSDKFFTKEYEQETNVTTYILLDASKSMAYSSNSVSKYDYSAYISAALSYLLLRQGDSVGFVIFSDTINKFLPPENTQTQLKRIMNLLEKTKPENKTKVAEAINKIVNEIKKRGIVILISDLLVNQEETIGALKNIRYKGNELIIFHILDESEKKFIFNEPAIFKDMETGEEIKISPEIKMLYEKVVWDWINKYKKELIGHKIDYLQLTTNESLENALLLYLTKR